MLSPKIGNTERKPRLIQGSTETSSHCYKAKTKKKKKEKNKKKGRREERKAIQIGKKIVVICKYMIAYIENLKGSTKKLKEIISEVRKSWNVRS